MVGSLWIRRDGSVVPIQQRVAGLDAFAHVGPAAMPRRLSTRWNDSGVPRDARTLRIRTSCALRPGVLGSIDAELRRDLLVQDEGSVVVAHAAGARPGERVLDLCAAPGGKTMILWADMNAQGSLIASDIRPARMQVLRDTLHDPACRKNLRPRCHRPLPFGPDTFDRVFVDVPCSGLGTLRRDPDVKWA